MSSLRTVVEAENRLERFNADRESILSSVTRRILAARVAAATQGGDNSLEYVINDVVFHEIRRLESSGGNGKVLHRWRDLSSRLLRLDEAGKRAELERLIDYYARDIVGNFNPRVYRFANDVLPPALSLLFAPLGSVREGISALTDLKHRIRVEGALDEVRGACDRGTLVIAPTHSSNMDSIVLGMALVAAKLPPVTYGAGKNLFTNPFISFFMRNLGAYRVDRRLKFNLYKDVLKEYSTVLLEHGYHSLFFPGGTRCRSNVVEQRLKLGLLGTTATAYRNNLRDGNSQRRIYVVPATINYRLTLEAETLMDDYLADAGKARYIITDDEFSRLGRIVEFVRKALVHEGALVVRLGAPLDVLGNATDSDGESVDYRGRRVDPASYFRNAAGEIVEDDQRDAEYTKRLGRRLAAGYLENTVFHSTTLASRVLFDAVAKRAGTRDVYRLMRAPTEHAVIPCEEVFARLERLQARIEDQPAWGVLHDGLRSKTAAEIAAEAFRALDTYHTRPVVSPSAQTVRVLDFKLLAYYHNRTSHIPVEAS